jgi:chromosome segregation ATPase
MVSYASQISSLERDIGQLLKDDAYEAKKEADLTTKRNRALEDAGRTKQISTVTSKLKDAERAAHDLANVQKKRADLAGRLASKRKDLSGYQERQAREDATARKKVADDHKKLADEQRKLMRERDDHERRLQADMRRRAELGRMMTAQLNSASPTAATGVAPRFDFLHKPRQRG